MRRKNPFPDRKPDAQIVGARDHRRRVIGGRRITLGLRGEERSRIGMAGIGEHARGLPSLDDLSLAHDDHVVGDPPDDVEIMGDEQHRHAELGLQVFQELEDLRLHGDVERGRRLIGDQKIGTIGERHGDHHPLALSARELVRIGAEAAAPDRRCRPRSEARRSASA